MNESADPLTRAIELSIEFEALDGAKSVEEFLREHESLRDILEPLLEPESTPDQRHILGDYELIRELGRGGMGVVYEAVQILLGRTVALKLLPPHRALSPRSLAMFRREATLAASLDHPGIAKVLDLQEADGQLALAMELIDGRPLDDVLAPLASRTPTTLEPTDLVAVAPETASGTAVSETFSGTYEFAAVELARQVAEALHHAHSRGVVHRDVKPGNILITQHGRAVLTDFGLAREEGGLGMTRTGEFAGTYQYAAPEQLQGRIDEIDGRTDIYALGATLYELLTMRRPIEAESLAELLQRIKREDPIRPARLNPRVTADLESVVLCALEKERSQRYANAEEFATDLRNVLLGAPVRARRLSPSVRATRWVRRNRLVTAFLAVLFLAALTTSFFLKKVSDDGRRIRTLSIGASIEGIANTASITHPIHPAKTAMFEELVRKFERNLAMRDELTATIDLLREGALLDATAARSPFRPPHPAATQIPTLEATANRLEVELADQRIGADLRAKTEGEIAAIRQEIQRLQGLLDMSNRVAIADEERSGLHDRFEQQLYELDLLAGTLLPDLRFRLDWSRRIEAASVTAHDAAWQAAIGRVAKSERYPDTTLAPHIGLVPLGPDPDTGLEEFAHLLSGEIPSRDANGRLQLTTDHAIVFVFIPGGTCERKDRLRDFKVGLDPFFVAKHEMSRAQWIRLARDLPGLRWRDGGVADVRNHGELQKPVNGISWHMCARLFERYDLDFPTSIQWEYATTHGRVIGQGDLKTIANLKDQAYATARPPSNPRPVPWNDGHAGLADIDAMQPGPGGLHHAFGNVAEWCRDSFLRRSAPPRPGDGLRLESSTVNQKRVLNGGHFQGIHAMLVGNRVAPDVANRTVGVRPIVRHLPNGRR